MTFDYCIIGGGIIGLATAMKLLELRPGASLILLEKETGLARHQTGHNSGVIHAGIYYAPGSFKAELCRRGAAATKAFCRMRNIPFEVCGKLLVATDALEVERMDALYQRAKQNNIEVERLDAAELRRREPNVAGLGALFVPSTGILDYTLLCEAMGRSITMAGGRIELGAEVTDINETATCVEVRSGERRWTATRLAVCAGLQSDRVARLAGLTITHQIVPFRGEYYRLPASKNDIIKHLIYPIPDPELPFLGIHLTRTIDGGVTVGPNAVLGLSREGYARLSVNLRDMLEFARFPGFWRTLAKYRKSALSELGNSLSKSRYLAECRRYCPSLELADLLPHQAGVRAQAVARDGALVHDFLFAETERMLHVCNAPSPGATSAIPIGEMIAKKCIGAEAAAS